MYVRILSTDFEPEQSAERRTIGLLAVYSGKDNGIAVGKEGQKMDRKFFIDALENIKKKVLAEGGEIHVFEIGEPVSMEFVSQVETKYGMRFPPDFIQFVTAVAGSVDVSWSILTKEWWENCKPLKLSKPDSGRMQWDFYKYLSEDVFYYFENPRNLEVLKQKLYLSGVPNGDIIFFDLSYDGPKQPIVYFSHDASYDGFPQLAPSFEDYIDALLKIGLVGNEFWETEPFVNEGKGGIDPECEAALEWRNFFGLM